MVTFCALYNYQNTPQAIPQQAALIRNIGAASVRLKVFDKLVSHINFHSDRVASDVLLVDFYFFFMFYIFVLMSCYDVRTYS